MRLRVLVIEALSCLYPAACFLAATESKLERLFLHHHLWNSTMAVKTKHVTDRRSIQYESYEELLADAEQLAGGKVRTTGNWSYPQILHHLAKSMDASIDGVQMKLPWLLKKFFLMMMKKEKMLLAPMQSGFQIPKQGRSQFYPDPEISTEDAMARFRAAIERCKSETDRAPHLLYGELTIEESDMFNYRHAELHMSFVTAE